MSLSTLTRYLRLRIATDLNQQASQNLARLDSLGFTFGVGETDDLEVRSRGNIVLKPEATIVGGAGSGGEIHLGSASQPAAIKFFASSFSVAGGAGNLLTEDSLNTITNKSISGNANLLSNVGYSSLLLSNSIKGSDIASDAAIPDSKLATISTAGKVNVSALTGSLSGSLLPSYTGNSGKYLSLVDGSLSWSTVDVPSTGVTSVNGQTGNVSLSTTDVGEGTNKYFTDSRAQTASVVSSATTTSTTQAWSINATRSYINDKIAKTGWSGTNSIVLNTGWGTSDVIFYVFEYTTNEQIIPNSITWDGAFNSATLSLPSGQVAGNWRVMAAKMTS